MNLLRKNHPIHRIHDTMPKLIDNHPGTDDRGRYSLHATDFMGVELFERDILFADLAL